MKKILIYLMLAILSIFLFALINIVTGVTIDISNAILNKSIFSWFYNVYGIVWAWDLWHYLIVAILSLCLTVSLISKLTKKLKEMKVL